MAIYYRDPETGEYISEEQWIAILSDDARTEDAEYYDPEEYYDPDWPGIDEGEYGE
jgi:hypothetical protein